jgi:hypothetical protein
MTNLNPPGDVLHSKFVNALRTQGKSEPPLSGAIPCPYPGHHGRIFLTIDQLYDHARTEHARQIEGFKPKQAREYLKGEVLKLR